MPHTASQRVRLVDQALKTQDMDNGVFLQNVRDRLDRVGIHLPSVTIRFRGLTASATAVSAENALPSIWNSYKGFVVGWLQKGRLLKQNKLEIRILKKISGEIRPGRLTLLLGPPSSGKSTLLKSMAGRLKDSGLKLGGEITFNGFTLDSFIPERTAAYVSQNDNHMAGKSQQKLTVRETLDFAARVQGPDFDEIHELHEREQELGIKPDPDLLAFMKASAKRGKRHSIMTDYVMRILGLEVCAETKVGSHMIRGISGGQKKRLTTGENVVGPTRTLLMDEITTGLDASTAFLVCRCIKNLVRLRECTVVISLLQPPPETYDLFDDIMLLAEGYLVYHGPRKEVLPFFESEVTSRKDQEQYWNKADPWKFIPAQELAEMFAKSKRGQANAAQLAQEAACTDEGRAALVHRRFALSRFAATKALLRREVTLMQRNAIVYAYRLCQVAIVVFAYSTVFLRTGLHPDGINDGQKYLAALFFTTYFLNASAWSELAIALQSATVFYRQRDQLFFPVEAYSLPVTLLRIPYSAIIAVAWTSFCYFVIGFSPQPGRFFLFLLYTFLVNQQAITIFRAIAAVGREVVLCNAFCFCYIGFGLLCNGFLVLQINLPAWAGWLYWINPLSYALRALVLNEFEAPRWHKPSPYDPARSLGTFILDTFDFNHAHWWTGASVGVLVAFILAANVVIVVGLKTLPPPGRRQAVVPPSKDKEDQPGPEAQPGKPQRQPGLRQKDSPGSEPTSSVGHSSGGLAVAPDSSRSLGGAAPLEPVSSRSIGGATPGHSDNPEGPEGAVLGFQPITLTFRDLHYFVVVGAAAQKGRKADEGAKATEIDLLHSITGAFRPGVLTALMGATGAGKTTLMDVVCCRKTSGRVTGEVKVNGHPQVASTFTRVSGYVEQNDLHSPQATIKEALWFSARLRLGPEVSNKVMWGFIYQLRVQVMELVELTPLQNALVGLAGVTGLSVEQRKRLTIAVELVANPACVFMDEPTSGLDARAAAVVMRVVRNIVATGRTITVTIHQPAIDIFEACHHTLHHCLQAFDELLLMKRGGYVIYQGPLGEQSSAMLEYFEAIPGVPCIESGYNPATYMLEVSTVSSEERIGRDLSEVYRESQLCREIEQMVLRLSQPAPGSKPLAFDHPFPQSTLAQLWICLRKNFVCMWRYPQFIVDRDLKLLLVYADNAARFTVTVAFGLLMGYVLWGTGRKRNTETGILQLIASQYLAALIVGFVNSATVQPILALERPVMYREMGAGMYSHLPFALAQTSIELPYIVIQAVLFATITYWMMELETNPGTLLNLVVYMASKAGLRCATPCCSAACKFFWYLLIVFLTLSYYTYYGMVAIACSPTVQMSSVVATLCYATWNLFSGFIMPAPQIGWWWRWALYVSPVYWTVYGTTVTQLGDLDQEELLLNDGTSTTISSYLRDSYDFKYGLRGWIIFILFGYAAVFMGSTVCAICKLNWQRR
eukprot:jgi/Astpho2/6227/Aster-03635